MNIDDLIEGYTHHPVTHGATSAKVWRLEKPNAPRLYLKQESPGAQFPLQPEVERTRWLRGKVPVPEVLEFESGPAGGRMLTTEIGGMPISDLHAEDLNRAVRLLASGLRQFHALAISDCPHDARDRLGEARQRLEAGLVPAEVWMSSYHSATSARLLDHLENTIPQANSVVLCHGDYCLPNVIVEEDRVTGFVDLGRVGVGDPYLDLGICSRSLANNFGPEWVPLFLAEYGLTKPDHGRLRWYRLLDEFF